MDIDDQAAVETIILAIEIEGPGRSPALFDDFSTTVGDRRLADRLDQVLDGGVCRCGRRGGSALRGLFASTEPDLDAAGAVTPHVCQIIPFPRRPVRPRASSPGSTRA